MSLPAVDRFRHKTVTTLAIVLVVVTAVLAPHFITGAAAGPTADDFFVDSGQLIGNPGGNAVGLGDLDGDGDLDAVLWNQIWLNNGAGVYDVLAQELDIPHTINELALGDLDADNDLDIVFALGGAANQVWLNDGAATFTKSTQPFTPSDSWALALGDLDADDDLDLVVANGDSHKVWFNDGEAAFTASDQSFGNPGLRAVELAMLDDNDSLDAIFADCTVWLNDGDGAFSVHAEDICASDNVTMDVGDVDGDGDIDAFIGNATKNPNFVFLNDGDANFSDSGQRLGDRSTEQITLGDFDADGDLDGFVANTDEIGSVRADQVWLNDGSGTFTDSGQNIGDYNSVGAIPGDINLDGDTDLLIGVGDGPNRVLWNTRLPRLFLPVILTK